MDKNHLSKQKSTEIQSGLEGLHPQEGEPQCSENQGNLRIAERLGFFYELCMIEDNLLNLFNKLNDSTYMNGIVNLSSYNVTNGEISVLSKGLGFCPIPGASDIDNIIHDLDAFKRRTRLQIFFSGSTRE